jgi:predicted transcriptional regulator
MSNSQSATAGVRPVIDPDADPGDDPDQGTDNEAMLSLMSDDYARGILDALGEQPLPARELVQRLDASRPTVYRRLDRLESAGVVESSMAIHPDGHHRKEFRIVVENVQLSFGTEGVTVEVTA